jgi:hypothetical protein
VQSLKGVFGEYFDVVFLYKFGLCLSVVFVGGIFWFGLAAKKSELPPQENYIPSLKAHFDACQAGSLGMYVRGWAQLGGGDDLIKIHIYAIGEGGAIKLATRRLVREDVSSALGIQSKFHLHGFYASAIGYRMSERYNHGVRIYVEDSSGVIRYGGEHVCSEI